VEGSTYKLQTLSLQAWKMNQSRVNPTFDISAVLPKTVDKVAISQGRDHPTGTQHGDVSYQLDAT
jgi:hypothetical protein